MYAERAGELDYLSVDAVDRAGGDAAKVANSPTYCAMTWPVGGA